MDSCFSSTQSKFSFGLLPVGADRRPAAFHLLLPTHRPLIVAAGVKCEFGGSSAPLEPRSPAGKHLSGVLLDDRDGFPDAARKELERLAVERDEAVARLQLSRGSDEACLHRRIAELKSQERNVAVEDIMYALILHKFYEIHVHLVPKLSKCICNGRLEIGPSKDWELESIHTVEVLEMVREHISSMVGCPANSCVKENWATTEIRQSCLYKLYFASILFGYFIKSASLRHRLEWGLDLGNGDLRAGAFTQLPMSSVSQYIAFGCIAGAQRSAAAEGQVSCRLEKECGNLRFYVMGFDQETVQMCAKPKSKEVAKLIERHGYALFGEEGGSVPEVITTSFGSIKRLLLEAVAFGCFLWDAEKWMNGVYMLEENQV